MVSLMFSEKNKNASENDAGRLYTVPSTINQRADLTYYFNWIQWVFFFSSNEILFLFSFPFWLNLNVCKIRSKIRVIFCRISLHESEKSSDSLVYFLFCNVFSVVIHLLNWQPAKVTNIKRFTLFPPSISSLFYFPVHSLSCHASLLAFSILLCFTFCIRIKWNSNQCSLFFLVSEVFSIKNEFPHWFVENCCLENLHLLIMTRKRLEKLNFLCDCQHASNLLSGETAYKDASTKVLPFNYYYYNVSSFSCHRFRYFVVVSSL